VELANAGGKWIDAVDASPESGLIAFAAGREARVLDAKDPKFARTFAHERSVAGLAFDPKGRKLACATYGGAALWFARIEGQAPQVLKWAGSHIDVAFSPDGKFLISAMQENSLHGWRLSDGRDMRMSGYAAKPRSLAFLLKGRLMATSGASGAVVWPFDGQSGPMGKEAAEIGFNETSLVTRVAALCAGCDDGRVWLAELGTSRLQTLREARPDAAITALAVSADGRRIAWGDEIGAAEVVEAPF
jgi:WD40 repeat protein